MVVALLLCTSAVTPIPRAKGERLFSDAPAKTVPNARRRRALRRFEQYESPDQQGDGRKQVKQRLTRVQVLLIVICS
ncbi:Uncharacterised protein [Escherichia coli]|uniref:Uncharacterized protein n=1 Tax=Escherichia coli TaxID=562 RepID=A0A376TZN8_ECOLX|nr:Uncharacterised protein [Escherichia coli]